MIALSGVRMSWLTVEKKYVFAFVMSSALVFSSTSTFSRFRSIETRLSIVASDITKSAISTPALKSMDLLSRLIFFATCPRWTVSHGAQHFTDSVRASFAASKVDWRTHMSDAKMIVTKSVTHTTTERPNRRLWPPLKMAL